MRARCRSRLSAGWLILCFCWPPVAQAAALAKPVSPAATQQPSAGSEAPGPGLAAYLSAYQLIEEVKRLNQAKDFPAAIETGRKAYQLLEAHQLSPADIRRLAASMPQGEQLKRASPRLFQAALMLPLISELGAAFEATADYPQVISLVLLFNTVTEQLSDNDWSVIATLSTAPGGAPPSPMLLKQTFQLMGGYLLSNAYGISGEKEKALSLAKQTLPLALSLQNKEAEAELLLIQAKAISDWATTQSQYNEVLTLAQQALEIGRSLNNDLMQSEALDKIAETYNKTADYQKAIEAATSSLAAAKTAKEPSATVAPLLTLASIYLNLGDYRQSRELYSEALAIARQLKPIPELEALSLALLSLNDFLERNYPKTLELATQSLDLIPKVKTPYLRRQIAMLANLLLAGGYTGIADNKRAIHHLQASRQLSRDNKDVGSEAFFSMVLGGAYRRNQQYQQSLEAYNHASAHSGSTEPGMLYTGLARTHFKLKQTTTALAYYQKAIEAIEQMRGKNRALTRNLQASLLQAIQDVDNTSIADIYREYADLLLSQGRSSEASQVLELLKLQELSEYTNSKPSPSSKPLAQTPTESRLVKQYGSLIAFGKTFDSCQKTNCPEKSQLADQRDALITEFNQRIQNLENSVRDRLSKDRGNLDTQDLRSVGKKIVEAQEGTVLINIFVADNKTWVLWVSRGGVVKSVEVPVGEPRIREAVNQFRQLLQTPTSSLQAVQSQGKLLYDWLIKPVEPELNLNKIQNLVFSLDRSARYIPMAALFDGTNYLVEKYSISTVLSAGLTDTESRLPAGTANTKVLGLGLSRPVAGFNALPNVPAELDVIIRNSSGDQKGIYPGKAFLNAEFDYRALRDNLQGHNILHIATHGVFVPGKQDDSYLVLGTGEKLPIPRIDNLEDLSDVHLVVLSACETALGETAKDGVEIPGVSFYFLNRRAKAVMASLWLVDDASTRILMEQFYASAASDPRPSKAQALRAAQLSLLGVSNGSGQASAQRGLAVQGRPTSSAPQPPTGVGYSHPYYWAPFILIGNGL
jgi:CHAT domain-containing protein